MKLPEVVWGAVQGSLGPAEDRVAAGAEHLSQTIASGLEGVSQEIVRSQTLDAHAALAERLDGLHTELSTRKAIPVAELKERLGGDFDKLDPSIKDPPTVQVHDPNAEQGPWAPGASQLVEKPGDVPTWKVADALFRAEAQKHLDAAAQHIGGPGWQQSFKRAAQVDLVHRLGQLDAQQAQAMHEDLFDARKRQVGAYVKSGQFTLARAALDESTGLFGEKGVRDAKDEVDVAEQVKPIFDGLTKINQPIYRDEGLKQVNDVLAQIGDPDKFTKLGPEARAKYAHELNTAASAHRSLTSQRDAAKLAFQIVQDSADPKTPGRFDLEKAFASLDERLKRGDFEGREELWPDTRRIIQERIRDQNEAVKARLSNVAGQAFSQFMALDTTNRPHYSLENIKPEVRTALEASGEEGQKILRDLVKWSEEEGERGRRVAQLPTSDQDALATAVERSIHRNPALWRHMKTEDQLAVLGGRAPVPGEEGTPEVRLSSRDFPHVRELLAKNTEEPQTVDVVQPHEVGLQEFERAFDLEGRPSKKWGKGSTEAMRLTMDEVSRFVNGKIRDPKGDGKRPSDEEIRDHLRKGIFRSVQVKRLMGLISPGETPALRAQVRGQTVVGESAPAQAAPAIPPPPAGTPKDWIPFRNKKNGEVRYNDPGKKHPDWQEAK